MTTGLTRLVLVIIYCHPPLLSHLWQLLLLPLLLLLYAEHQLISITLSINGYKLVELADLVSQLSKLSQRNLPDIISYEIAAIGISEKLHLVFHLFIDNIGLS